MQIYNYFTKFLWKNDEISQKIDSFWHKFKSRQILESTLLDIILKWLEINFSDKIDEICLFISVFTTILQSKTMIFWTKCWQAFNSRKSSTLNTYKIKTIQRNWIVYTSNQSIMIPVSQKNSHKMERKLFFGKFQAKFEKQTENCQFFEKNDKFLTKNWEKCVNYCKLLYYLSIYVRILRSKK